MPNNPVAAAAAAFALLSAAVAPAQRPFRLVAMGRQWTSRLRPTRSSPAQTSADNGRRFCVGMGQSTKSLRSSPLRGGKSREIGSN
jgi:hypothetical protein